MTEQDARWLEALIGSGVVKTIPLHEDIERKSQC